MRKNIPTIPILRLLLGRPRRTFFSWAGAFFGGILFLREASAAEEREKDRLVGNERLELGAQRLRRLRRLNRSLTLIIFQKKSNGVSRAAARFAPRSTSHNSTHSPAYPLTLGRAGCFTTPLYPPSTMKTFKNAVLFILSLTMAVKSQKLVTTTNACVSH